MTTVRMQKLLFKKAPMIKKREFPGMQAPVKQLNPYKYALLKVDQKLLLNKLKIITIKLSYFKGIDDDTALERYLSDFSVSPIPQRLNKRFLKVKPHFVLTSKPEMTRKKEKQQEKEEFEVAKQNRALLREKNKHQKVEN